MEDNAHMSEKVLLSEQAQESLRVSLSGTRGIYFMATQKIDSPLKCF